MEQKPQGWDSEAGGGVGRNTDKYSPLNKKILSLSTKQRDTMKKKIVQAKAHNTYILKYRSMHWPVNILRAYLYSWFIW